MLFCLFRCWFIYKNTPKWKISPKKSQKVGDVCQKVGDKIDRWLTRQIVCHNVKKWEMIFNQILISHFLSQMSHIFSRMSPKMSSPTTAEQNIPENWNCMLKGVNQNITHAKNLTQLHTENVCAQLRDHLFLSFFEGAAFCWVNYICKCNNCSYGVATVNRID